MSSEETPWYRDGLSFACTQCGGCCTGAPGYVWLDEAEMAGIAEHLGLPFDEFTRAYVRRVRDGYSLRERPNGDCALWDDERGCTVYPARPLQCRTFPFWPEHLESPEAWRRLQAACPGARDDGTRHALVAIEGAARSMRERP